MDNGSKYIKSRNKRMDEANRIQQLYTHTHIKYICGVPLAGILIKVLCGERGINGQMLKALFHKQL